MVSRENTVIAVFAVAAVFTLVSMDSVVADTATWQQFALLLGIGVLASTLVNNYLDTRETG